MKRLPLALSLLLGMMPAAMAAEAETDDRLYGHALGCFGNYVDELDVVDAEIQGRLSEVREDLEKLEIESSVPIEVVEMNGELKRLQLYSQLQACLAFEE